MKPGKIKIFFVLMITGIFVSESLAQEWILGGPWGSDVIWMTYNIHDTTQVYCGQESGGMWLSEDGGRTWENISNELPDEVGDEIRQILFHPVSEDTMWLVAHSLFMSTDGGENSNEITNGLEDVTLSCMIVLSHDPDILIAGNLRGGNGVYRSTDCGESWTIVDSSALRSVTTIVQANSNPEKILVCYYHQDFELIYQSMDDGETWERIVPFDAGNFMIGSIIKFDIDRENSDHLYAIGRDLGYASLWHTLDNGRTWIDDFFNYINPKGFFIDQGGVMYVKYPEGIFRSSDHGNNWITTAVNVPKVLCYYGEHSNMHTEFESNPMNNATVMMASSRGLFISSDYGDSTEMVGKGLGFSRINKLISADDGSNNFHALTDQGHWVYAWENREWSAVNPWIVNNIYIDPDSPDSVILVGENIWRSSDGGMSYEIMEEDEDVFFTDILKVPGYDSLLYVSWVFGLARSENYGETWELVEMEFGNTYFNWDLEAETNDPDVIYLGQHGLFRSGDAGYTWYQLNDMDIIDLVLDPNSDDVYIISEYQSIWYSDNGGYDFEIISGTLPDTRIWQIALRPYGGSELFAATEQGVYFTNDYGDHWNLLDGPYDSDTRSICFSEDGTDLLIGTDGLGVWIAEELYINDVPDRHQSPLNNHFKLKGIFPNPFNSNARIEIFTPLSTNLEVKIYSIEGKLICSLFDGISNTGINRIYWDGRDYQGQKVSSGIYFIEAGTGSGKWVSKVALLK